MTGTTETTLGILKQDRLGRVRTPRGQRERLLAEYGRSGMSGREFAAYAGIKYQTFATWVQKRRKGEARTEESGRAPAVTEALQWMEAVVGGEPEESDRKALVVELGGGARMEVRDETGAKLAAEVLRHLGGARAC